MKFLPFMTALMLAVLLAPKSGLAETGALQPCPASTHSKILDYESKALCARISVAEAKDQTSRSIKLNVVVLPATTRTKQPDPVVLLAGGPGQAAVSIGPMWAARFENLRKHRDFLLIDQRGTGDSNSLACEETLAPIFDETELDGDVERVLSRQITALKDCLVTLDADPRFYTTIEAASDLEAVRAQLGYPQLNLFGVSYGTRIALVFNALYPDSVRSLLLDAVAPVNMLIPVNVGLDADLAFQRIAAECTQTPSCQAAYPDLPAQLKQAEQRLREAPSQSMTNPLTGEQKSVTLDHRMINRLLRGALYSRSLRQVIPLAISEAAKGRWQVLTGIADVLSPQSNANDLSLGMMASVLCSEDMSRVKTQTDGVYFENALQELLIDVCPIWPHTPVPSCQAAYPDLPAQLKQAEQRLREAPSQSMTNPLTGEQKSVTLDHRMINRLLRGALYSRSLRQVIPLAISEAAKGRWQVLTGIADVLSPQSNANDLSLGMMASVLCSEDMSRVKTQTDGVYFENALQELLIDVCPIWPHTPVAADYFTPKSSAVPALLMSGTEDPITPPVYAERALAYLPNGHHLEVIGGAHGVSQLGCLPSLIEGFLKDLSLTTDEAECVQAIGGQPFFSSYAGPFETQEEAPAND